MGEVDLTFIKDLTLSIKYGEFVAIVGTSGSGTATRETEKRKQCRYRTAIIHCFFYHQFIGVSRGYYKYDLK